MGMHTNLNSFRQRDPIVRLNAVCPYYTMYPLSFPLGILKNKAQTDEWVLDPFCGRGTTNFAARVLGLPSVGIDSSPIAVAIAKSKIVTTSPSKVVRTCKDILKRSTGPTDVPSGGFWKLAYHRRTLADLCKLREVLSDDCMTEPRIALRAIILGALHGPLTNGEPSYFSNQCPRTFAPKPAYAERFWRDRKMNPNYVDVIDLVKRKAQYYFSDHPSEARGTILEGDSRRRETFNMEQKFSWVITSPPYYGMRTYMEDQWLRAWFIGGSPEVPYGLNRGLRHESREMFIKQLSRVWRNAASVCLKGGRLICRFGKINYRNHDSLHLVLRSFRNTGWRVVTVRSAGTATNGKRQALQFGERITSKPRAEHDIYARLES
jgi:hypothetical protein